MYRPSTIALPEVEERYPVIIFIVVVLPAPFGPRKPTTSPSATSKLMSFMAYLSPYFFVRCSILIISYSPLFYSRSKSLSFKTFASTFWCMPPNSPSTVHSGGSQRNSNVTSSTASLVTSGESMVGVNKAFIAS